MSGCPGAAESRTIATVSHVEAQLAYARVDDVSLDDPRRGLRRARTLTDAEMNDPVAYDHHLCRIRDVVADQLRPDLRVHGFTHADLSRHAALQRTLQRVRAAGRLDDAAAADIRRRLLGRVLTLSNGDRMLLVFLARDGFFMRRAGPNGLRVGNPHSLGRNDHDAAREVHADQDVEGTPLRQILRGAAPWLFHHDSPDRHNHRSPLHLVNLWIPLEQATRPLALMDRGSLDRRAHQLRFGLPTDTFLRRREDMRVNDIWAFLHDERQRWYFTADMDASTAYVFSTLGTPHGSFILPGEAAAETRYRRIVGLIAAVQRRDELAAAQLLVGADEPVDAVATAGLRQAIAAMDGVLAEARAAAAALCRSDSAAAWCTRAAAAADRVVRKSLEMRAIGVLLPRWR